MNDHDKSSILFGVAVQRRYEQRKRQMPEFPDGVLVAWAASDVCLVLLSATGDATEALDAYFAAEEAML